MKRKRRVENLIILSVVLQLILIAMGKMNQLLLIASYSIQLIGILYYLKEDKLLLTRIQKSMINFLLILFVLVVCMVMFSQYRSETLITTILVFINIIFICVINFLDKDGRISKNIIKYFFIFIIFLAVYGIILRIFGTEPTTSTINGVTRSRQFLRIGNITLSQIVMGKPNENYGIASLTPNPNSLSYFLIYALIINTVYTQTKKVKKQKKVLNFILYIVIIFGIILAGSRLAIILIPIAYLVPKILFMKNKKKISFIILLAISIILLILLYLLLIDFPILESIDLNGRDLLWSNVPRIISDHMILGEGVGSSILILEDMLGVEQASMHNTYFVMISDFGLLFTVITCILIIITVIKNIKRVIKNEYSITKQQQIVLAISMIILILLQGMSESTIFTLSVPSILFFYMLATLIKWEGKDEEG